MARLPFEVGRVYDRQKDIHAVFKGQERGGISTPTDAPFIFLFTGESGEQYGYKDGWISDGVFLYTGEGQIGDMEFVRGNKAIRDHAANGRDLLLFESLSKEKGYRYLGEFGCTSWETRPGSDKLGDTRKVIVFHLVPLETRDEMPKDRKPSLPLEELRRKALDASKDVSERSPTEAKRSYFERSEAVRTYVLARAAGTCEACKKSAPFYRPDGSPYLEPHHTRRVSDGGPDDPRWVAAVCPNCHKEIHYGTNGSDLNRRIQEYLSALESR